MNANVKKDSQSEGFTVSPEPEEYFYGAVLPDKVIEMRPFTIGDRVRIRKDSPHANQNDGVGTIVGWSLPSVGYAVVKFDDGITNTYFALNCKAVGSEINLERCELELANKPCLVVPITGPKIGDLVECKNPRNITRINPGSVVKVSIATGEIFATGIVGQMTLF